MSCSCENPCRPDYELCPALGFQDAIVGVPVEIEPFADVGKIKTECIGKPVINRGICICENKPKEKCRFTICQEIRVTVPVIFGARAEVGESRIECKHPCRPCGHEKEYEAPQEFTGFVGDPLGTVI